MLAFSFIITLGGWIVPLVLSLFAIWFFWLKDRRSSSGQYGGGLAELFDFGAVIISLLFIWLIYFIIAYFTK